MTEASDVQMQLLAAWLDFPSELRSTPASEDDLLRFEADFARPIPRSFRWFLLTLGGGPVGSEWIDDIDKLRVSHQKFHAEREHWETSHAFIIGWDGGGNPLVIEPETGRVLVEDHTFGGVQEVATSFEEFLARELLKRT